MIFGTHLALDNSDHVLDGGPNPPTEGGLRGVLQNVPRHVSCIMGVLQNVPRHVPVGHLSTSWALVFVPAVIYKWSDLLEIIENITRIWFFLRHCVYLLLPLFCFALCSCFCFFLRTKSLEQFFLEKNKLYSVTIWWILTRSYTELCYFGCSCPRGFPKTPQKLKLWRYEFAIGLWSPNNKFKSL